MTVENADIILQIFLVTVGMYFLGLVLNRVLGLKRENMKALRAKTFNLQERMKNAQALGNLQLMREAQIEMSLLMKEMLKKQFIPMCVRCVIFLGIFSVLGIVYGEYEFWFWLYFIFSLSISFLGYGIMKLYRKATGKEDKSKRLVRELMGIASPNLASSSDVFQYSESTPPPPLHSTSQEKSENSNENQLKEKSDSWKDRIQND